MEAAQLALASNAVTAAIQEAAIRGQIDATKNAITILCESLEILNRQYAFDSIAKADVIAQEAAHLSDLSAPGAGAARED